MEKFVEYKKLSKKRQKMIDIHKVLLYNTCRRVLWQKQVKIILAGEEF